MLNNQQIKTIKSHKAYDLNVSNWQEADCNLVKSTSNDTFTLADLGAVSFNGTGNELTEILDQLVKEDKVWYSPDLR